MEQCTLLEQRNFERVPVSFPVKITCQNREIYMAQVRCLSKGGFLCAMKKSLLIESLVKATLLLPPDKDKKQSTSISITCNVVRENLKETLSGDIGHIVALKFSDISKESEELITSYLQSISEHEQHE